MRDTRLYSSAVYEADLKKYKEQLDESGLDSDAIARLERWIVTTERYRDEALAQGL
jgi:hypothetical protein